MISIGIPLVELVKQLLRRRHSLSATVLCLFTMDVILIAQSFNVVFQLFHAHYARVLVLTDDEARVGQYTAKFEPSQLIALVDHCIARVKLVIGLLLHFERHLNC